MSLLLRRSRGQALLVVPDRPHTADEITTIRVRDINPDKSIGFVFDISDGYSIALEEKYTDRHGHHLVDPEFPVANDDSHQEIEEIPDVMGIDAEFTTETCSACGSPMGLEPGDTGAFHVDHGLCDFCWLDITRERTPKAR